MLRRTLISLFVCPFLVFDFLCLLMFWSYGQGEEPMLSAMVEVTEAVVNDMEEAKTCYRKIFSV